MNAVELTRALVQFDSRNPSLAAGAPGERGVAFFLAETLERWGFQVAVQEVTDGRPNVIARAGRSRHGARSIILNGHLDVVGIDGMTHPPFAGDTSEGLLYGRGSADMKSGIAAMCVAAREAVRAGIDGEVIIAAVIDEEYESLGTRALIASGITADAAVITEPTQLALAPAHRGFVWARLSVRGRAAHGSRYDLGIDAITRAALILAELDRIQRETLTLHSHPLLGRPSLHASLISGGNGISTYPELCTVEMERRTIPGEGPATFLAEIRAACEAVRSNGYEDLEVAVELTTSQGPSDVALDAPVMTALSASLAAEGVPVRVEGLSAWTDAALFNDAGIPTVCFGPGDISLAHSATEYVPVGQIDDATRVLTRFVLEWCKGN